MAALFTASKFSATDSSGNPLAGGFVHTYAAGTTTPKATYTTQAGNVANANPVVLDSSGRANIWLGSGAYKFVVTDSTGAAAPDGTVDNITAPALEIAADLANSTTATKGAAMIGYAPDLYPAGATLGAQVGGFINAAIFGAVADGVTDNTAEVQDALDALGAAGGVVQVTPGTRFNLQSLTFPQRSNLDFWMDDDLSRPNPATTLGTNERVLFMANANDDGIVNETRVTAPFHPGINLDVRRDVAGHDAHLGPTQVRVPTATTPARASFNIQDQQVETWRKMYEIFGGPSYDIFSGVFEYTWYRTVVITGIGSGNFSAAPAVGQLLTGTVSGARAWYLTSDVTTTTLLWLDGRFAATDGLVGVGITTATTASSVAFNAVPMQPLAQDLRKGNWSFGLPAGLGDELLNVGGRVMAMPTRTFGQQVSKTITSPGYMLLDSVSGVPTNGFVMHYNTVPAASSRRVTLRKVVSGTEQTTDAANVGACTAHCTFDNAAGVSNSAFNIASVTRTGTGRYAVVFTRAMERADYCINISLEEGSTKGGYPISKTTAGFTLAVATLGGTVAVDLAALASIAVFGGDI